MSKVKIEGNASGTGTLTISAPNTNTDRNLTLPDGAGEILLANGDGSQLTNLPGGGKVLQVVNDTEGTLVTQTSTSVWTDAGLSASITPSSTSSKVLVMFSVYTRIYTYNTNGENEYGLRIKRGGTVIHETDVNGLRFIPGSISSGYTMNATIDSMVYLDSPSTTSATAYTIEGIMNTGAVFNLNSGGTPSQLTLMEIGA